MLITLVKNELIKLLKKVKTWLIFILFLGIIAIGVFSQYSGDKNMREWMSPEGQIKMLKQDLQWNEGELEYIKENNEVNADEEYIQYLNEEIENAKQRIKEQELLIGKEVDEDFWKQELDNRILEVKENIKSLEEESSFWAKESIASENEYLESLQYLKDNDIKPMESWEYEANNFLTAIMEILGMAILLCGIAVFMSDIVSGEYTPATLKFLLIQPVSRGKILLSKFIAVVTTVLTMIIGGELLGYLFIRITSGVNGNSYPVRINNKYTEIIGNDGYAYLEKVAGSGEIVSNGKMVLLALLLQILFIIAACSFIFMISALIKSSMITMALSVVATIFLNILSGASTFGRNIAHLLFVNYGDSISLLTGNLNQMYSNEKFGVTMGITILVGTIVITNIISYINFKNKDILI